MLATLGWIKECAGIGQCAGSDRCLYVYYLLSSSSTLLVCLSVNTPLPSTRQLKRIHSRAKKTPPHTRGGIRANKTQNPPFSHTPKSTRMKILPFLTPLNTHIHTHTSSHTLAVAFYHLHYITWQLRPSALYPLTRPLPPRSPRPRPPRPSPRRRPSRRCAL